jgi:STE24 endopeptidase
MHWLTTLFIAAILLHVCVQLLLAWRQCRAVRWQRGAVPAVFAGSFTAADQAKASDYTIAKQRVAAWHVVVDALALAWLTLGGGIDVFARVAESLTSRPLLTGTLHVLLVGAALAVLGTPFSIYRQFGIEQRFGFNRTSPGLFVSDLAKAWLLGGGLLGLVVLAILAVMRSVTDYWWLLAWVIWVSFSLVMLIAWPRWIAPLFNRFSRVEDAELRGSIDALLSRQGFAMDEVFVMDGSRRSAHGNAYFTGLGKQKRIVFFDTLLSSLTVPQVIAVLAHELAHFRLHHVGQRLLAMSAGALAGFALLAWLARQPWFYSALGVGHVSESSALLLFVLVTPTFTWLLDPLLAAWSRRHEFQADAFASRNADAGDLADALVKLYHDSASTLTPDRWYSAFHDSHPPPTDRISRLRVSAASALPKRQPG